MTVSPGFILTCLMASFSVWLIGWDGYKDYQSGWVFGLLAVIWSLMMMLRLLSLSSPDRLPSSKRNAGLAQTLLDHFYQSRENFKRGILVSSVGGAYPLFVTAVFSLCAWFVYCAVMPASAPLLQDFQVAVEAIEPAAGDVFFNLYAQAHLFMLSLLACVAAFVLRSQGAEMGAARPVILVCAGYAIAGLILFYGFASDAGGIGVRPQWTGSGAGTGAWLASSLYGDARPSLFDILILEGGVVSVAIAAFALFVPLGALTLSSTAQAGGHLIVAATLMIAVCLILSFFIPFFPALGAYMAMCLMGIFLAWGVLDNNARVPAYARA